MATHGIVFFEVPADDPKRAQKFYQQTFGWQFSIPEGFTNYWMIKTGEREDQMGGGLVKNEPPYQGILTYIGVDDVPAYVEKVQRAGGEILVPPSPVPQTGWFAICRDTEGNRFALWQNDPGAETRP